MQAISVATQQGDEEEYASESASQLQDITGDDGASLQHSYVNDTEGNQELEGLDLFPAEITAMSNFALHICFILMCFEMAQ